jgi:asparagine synthase (glutamine-hydrolysing)
MAASIESRTPLLDFRLVELMLTVPERHRFHANRQKPLLRAAVGPWLPDAVTARTDKRGFPTPLHHWRGRPALRALVERTLGSRREGQAVFSQEYLDRRESFQPSELWTALMVEGWLRRRAPAALVAA